jgi:ferredoxin
MAHLSVKSAYHDLVERLNKFPQGAPASEFLMAILSHLFSEREARLISLLPLKAFTAEKAAGAWKMDIIETRKTLNHLCSKALLVDIRQKGRTIYCLPPPMAGFFEFSLMRLRSDIDQKALSELLYHYINVEEDFAAALFARGNTPLGRVFVQEPQIEPLQTLTVLDYERASHAISTAGAIGLGLCYCRHKMSHMGRACDKPQETCLTLNFSAAALIRHGHARDIDAAEAMDLLHTAYSHHLVQFGENVRQEVNFICNCCKCCCEAMIAARRFAVFHPVQTTNFIANLNIDQCVGCGLCTQVCPVEAIRKTDIETSQTLRIHLNPKICLGCGLCAQVCATGAMTMAARPARVVTPMNTAHRVVSMAIERNNLQHIIFDNQVLYSHRALATLLGVIFRLAPVKRILAARQLQSRYLESLIDRLRWQPSADYDVDTRQPSND